ncbi:hypothetical protein BT93_H1729 [Corymbia citriodora subsp. variegata]|nr:hypothetical protein BT93_H1729 [Corymbia citriodora subsp. variegata]
MAENIPEDIIIDILLRLPAKSLTRFKSVCKRWWSLISDPGFAKSHLQRLKSGDLIPSQRIFIADICDICGNDDRSYIATIDYEALDSGEGHMVVPHRIKPFWDSLDVVGSCDGLVCFLCCDIFIIYNPTTREYNELPSSDLIEDYEYVYLHNDHSTFYGFGYDPQSDDYKVVEGIHDYLLWTAAIYSFKSRSWRRIYLPKEEESRFVVYDNGVYWKGALHWHIRMWYSTATAIISLDLSEEEFNWVLSVPEVDEDRRLMDLGIHGTSLFIYGTGCCPSTRRSIVSRIEAWITDEYRQGGSWTKWFSVDCLPSFGDITPLAYTRSGRIVFLINLNRVILFNPENNTYKDYPIGMDKFLQLNHAVYLETLVSPYFGSEPSRIERL